MEEVFRQGGRDFAQPRVFAGSPSSGQGIGGNEPAGAGNAAEGSSHGSAEGASAGVADSHQPAGVESVIWTDQYQKDAEGGWVWGNHSGATEQQKEAMKQMVRSNRDCFAYSMAELQGYRMWQ